MQSYITKVKNSFLKAGAGEENFTNIIWFWGIIAYLIIFFIIEKLLRIVANGWFTYIISIITIIYFCWHIFVIHKCKPKSPKLSKIEKKLKKQEEKKQFVRITLEKIFLQRSWTKWNTATVLTAVDLYIITNFLGYIL